MCVQETQTKPEMEDKRHYTVFGILDHKGSITMNTAERSDYIQYNRNLYIL